MKNQHLACIIAMLLCAFNLLNVNAQEKKAVTSDSTLIQYDGYDTEFASDTTNVKETIQVSSMKPVLIFEKDTFDFGTIVRTDAVLLEHILCKCNSDKDVCVKKANITNMHGRVSCSPRIVAGAKGTILCIIDKKSLKFGEHVDKITIITDSELSPEISIYVKYNVIQL